jgi:hypothetical protein
VEDRQNTYKAKKDMELVEVEDGEDQDVDEDAEEAMVVDPFVNTEQENVQLSESSELAKKSSWKWVTDDIKYPYKFV